MLITSPSHAIKAAVNKWKKKLPLIVTKFLVHKQPSSNQYPKLCPKQVAEGVHWVCTHSLFLLKYYLIEPTLPNLHFTN